MRQTGSNMNFIRVGTEYGGWMINPDLIKEGTFVVSAGIGEDISFDQYLIDKKNCKIIGIDPTPKSHQYIENFVNLKNFELIKKALSSEDEQILKMFKNKNPNHVSESIFDTHSSVNFFDSYYCETISLNKIFEQYKNISVVKMDIEGSEYDVINSIEWIPESVRQFCVEFHHFCTNKTIDDTKNCILKINNLGFKNFIEKPSTKELNEITFWR